MINIPDDIHKLIEEYKEKFNKAPRRFNYDVWNSLDEYKEYLEKELKNSTY